MYENYSQKPKIYISLFFQTRNSIHQDFSVQIIVRRKLVLLNLGIDLAFITIVVF